MMVLNLLCWVFLFFLFLFLKRKRCRGTVAKSACWWESRTCMHTCCIVLAAYLELGRMTRRDFMMPGFAHSSIVSYGILLNGRVGWDGMVEREGEGREIPVFGLYR